MKLDIPTGEFAGYIFDCDGTLVDTMPLHYRAWDRAMQAAGLKETLSEELFAGLAYSWLCLPVVFRNSRVRSLCKLTVYQGHIMPAWFG